jgi:chorismate synthase
MSSNTLGKYFTVSSFGESHGKCIGAIIDGCPAGLDLSEADVQPLLNLRRPGQSIITTQRKETDTVEILSGVFNGFTTGAPICMIIWNKDSDSRSYDEFISKPRPGHADYTAFLKYGGFNDFRGSGRFSGRLTATIVMGGAVALKILKNHLNIEIISYTKSIGDITMDSAEIPIDALSKNRYLNEVRCPDQETAVRMRDSILSARKEGDSLGGVIECIVRGVPPGLGEPIFESIESEISRGIFSIPAVKGLEFGSGFRGSTMKGSENNDSFVIDKSTGNIITDTNRSGGILGGITDGMPIVFRVAFKPAASIPRPQKTVNLKDMTEYQLTVTGRHDPCVVPRAPPVVDSIAAIVLLDCCFRSNLIPRVIG